MSNGIPVLAGLLVISGALSTAVAALLWNERPKSGTTPLLFVEVSLALWAFGQVLVVVGGPVSEAAGAALSLFAMSFIGPALFLFACQYTGHTGAVSTRLVAGLAIVPLAVFAVGVLSVAGAAGLGPVRLGYASQPTLAAGYGPVFWGVVAYTYTLLFVGDYYLFGKFVGSRNVYRKRTFFFLAYSLLLTACHALSSVGLSPTPHYTLAPLANLVFGSLSLLVFVGYRSYGFLPLKPILELFGSQSKSLAPVARTAMIEEMGGGMLVTDHRNRVVDINPMGRKILGDPDARVVGRPLKEVLPPDIFVDEDDTRLLDSGVAGNFSGVWVRTPTGEQRCFDVLITELDGEGATGRVSLIHDVTERERRKQTLEERTAELRRQNEQLEDFAGIVSHDLRNPLNVADGAIELARRNEQFEYLDRAENAHERMETIIEDVLTLARQGQTVDETERVSLCGIAEAAWANVETGAATLTCRDDAEFEADRNRLLQLFENLFRNSVEHGSTHPDSRGDATDADDGVTVTVGMIDDEPDADDRSAAGPRGFYVADDGPGIPEDQRDAVLEQGYTTSENGTGLGLSIVSTIVDAHGWEIDVAESVDGGAEFRITGLVGGEPALEDEPVP
ncbi:histidine kinase N-terminal 7TM domain-containing protein [Halorientalis regularis]|uniref:histidine kinase n=1 Tax=Halorientalis regularis TaxID=660518 RepID=A0A1G7HSK7_9EURY|nr:histidine kinase N-terminal 7TM domain-containing protein [Halorientalis regularis]SDF03481.1 PAS domain S-box-containing protein [Halorientalis regularis]